MKIIKLDEVAKLSISKFFLNLFFLSSVATFFYQQRGLNYFQILSLESVFVMFMFLFEVPTGIFADKYGRKKSIILGTLLLSTEPLIYLVANNYLFFATSFAISAIGMTFLSGTVEALIYDNLKKKGKEGLMKKAMGQYESSGLLAMVIAPVIGSWIAKDLATNQFTLLIIMTSIVMLIGFFVSLFIKDTIEKEVDEDSPITLLKDGVKLIKENKSLLHIIILSILSSPFPHVLIYLFQPYLKASQVDISYLGLILSISLLISAGLQKYAYKIEKRLGMKKSVFLSTLLPGIGYLLMSFIFSPIFSIIVFVALRSIMGIRVPLFSDYKNYHIPSRIRATTLSLIAMLASFYQIVMRLVIGKIADFNLSYAFVLMGIVIVFASLLFRIKEGHLVAEK